MMRMGLAALFCTLNIIAWMTIVVGLFLVRGSSFANIAGGLLFLQTLNIVYAMSPTAKWIMGDD